MTTAIQYLFGLYWAKHPQLEGLPPLPETLSKIGLSEPEAIWLRNQYATVLAGGARAAKVLSVSDALLRDVLEQFDELPAVSLLGALKEALGADRLDQSTTSVPADLAIPYPHHLNGLVVWLLGHPGGAASMEAARASYAEICRGGGSPAKVDNLAMVAEQLGLLVTTEVNWSLTDRGWQYGEGGSMQGSSLWELTETRRKLILGFWEAHTSETPVLRLLESTLKAVLDGAALVGKPQRWLLELEVLTESGYLSIDGGRILKRVLLTQQGTLLKPTGVLREFLDQVTLKTGELQLDIARLRDEFRAVTGAKTTVGAALPTVSAPKQVGATELRISLDDVLSVPFKPVSDELAYLQDCAARLRHSGYQIQDEELINLYVCTRSGRLTVLAGAPGVGKSSLVRKFATALGHGAILKEISVRRGWTDDQQFLGAVNRLHQRYDPASAGIVQHLLKADVDREYGLYFVLLDEFNLSVPEYYFAEFISVLESDAPAVRLYPAGMTLTNSGEYPSTVPINPTVHFFGTVNLDETGFPMSPRLLDRANFVWVERKVGLEVLDGARELPLGTVGPIAASEYLARQKSHKMSDAARSGLKKVVDCLAQEKREHGSAHVTSPRALLGVAAYLANSQGLLQETDALDYAVLQRILPGLRGIGDAYGKRMQALAGILQEISLKRSHRLLRRMIESGAQHGEYNFVASLW